MKDKNNRIHNANTFIWTLFLIGNSRESLQPIVLTNTGSFRNHHTFHHLSETTGFTLPLQKSQNVSLTDGSLILISFQNKTHFHVSHNATLASIHESDTDLEESNLSFFLTWVTLPVLPVLPRTFSTTAFLTSFSYTEIRQNPVNRFKTRYMSSATYF